MKLAVEVEDSDEKLIVREYRKLLRSAKMSDNKDRVQVRKAFDIAMEAHKGVRRKSGEPYILHPLAVAQICVDEIGLGPTSIVCALLHDVVEDSSMTILDMEDLFGEKVARIIDGLTKVENLFDQPESVQAENFRKVLLTMADDVRVILIKLADRLHNMRTLGSMRKDKQLKIAAETLYIYAPLAHRLGLYNIKSELEDLSLSFKAPTVYEEIERKLKKTQAVRTRFVNRFTSPIKRELDSLGLAYEIKGRTKSVHSIYTKMRNKNIPFEEVYDVFAIRIIIDTDFDNEKNSCWKVYSLITDFYQPNPDRLRDWISTPKANGYESLHTTVMSPTGKWVEVQIRTKRMDEIAEKGYAAHWKYKEKNQQVSSLDAWVNRIRELLENPETNAVDFVDDFKLNLFAKEIFVFTPTGDIRSLPQKSTVIDFAYEIHSQLGNRCVGAKVNNRLVPVTYVLQSGDQVEIITSKGQSPSEEWLSTAVSAKAKSAIKNYLRSERKSVAEEGEKKLLKLFMELGIQDHLENFRILKGIFKLDSKADLFYKVGSGDIAIDTIKSLRVSKGKISYKTSKINPLRTLEDIVEATRGKKDALVIGKQSKLKYQLATCCNPIPGDDVLGFITKDGSIFIHRVNCPNTIRIMSNYGYRVVKAKWDDRESLTFLAGLKLNGFDRQGIVNQITQIISDEMSVTMKSISFESHDGLFDGTIMVYVNDTQHLKNLRDKISKIQGIMAIHRIE
jgi:GTP pyrophosphokinase